MSKIETKRVVDAYIKRNGKQEITGPVLNAVLTKLIEDYAEQAALSLKQDAITDLNEIRSGAAAGATALQPDDLEQYATKSEVQGYLAAKQDVISDLDEIRDNASQVGEIESLIPDQASAENQLADKDFVNSSVATNTAYFRGTFNSVEELEAYPKEELTNNDYAFVITAVEGQVTAYNRYKWDTESWQYEYTLNNSSFTAEQWAAINSGITSDKIEEIESTIALMVTSIHLDVVGGQIRKDGTALSYNQLKALMGDQAAVVSMYDNGVKYEYGGEGVFYTSDYMLFFAHSVSLETGNIQIKANWVFSNNQGQGLDISKQTYDLSKLTDIGTLSSLKTTVKNNVVNAINELHDTKQETIDNLDAINAVIDEYNANRGVDALMMKPWDENMITPTVRCIYVGGPGTYALTNASDLREDVTVSNGELIFFRSWTTGDFFRTMGRFITKISVADFSDYASKDFLSQELEAALAPKTEKVRIDIEESESTYIFKKGNDVLNFQQLNDLLQNSPDFCVFVHGNREHRCVFIDTTSSQKVMRFVAPVIADQVLKAQAFTIFSNDGVEITAVTKTDINSENQSNKTQSITGTGTANAYPSTKAVVDYAAKKSELTELQSKVGEFKVKDATKSADGKTMTVTKSDGTSFDFSGGDTGGVKSVNGNLPDAQGNVVVEGIPAPDDVLRRDLGKYTSNEQYAALSVAEANKAVNTSGTIVTKSGYGISNEIAITKGSVYLFKSNSDIADVALFTQKIVADIVYNTIEETITTSGGETVTRLKSKSTAKGGDLKSHTYEFIYNSGNETAVWDNIKDNGSSKGASFAIPTQYTEYVPMFSANGVVARPISGHYCLASSVSGTMVISAKTTDLTGYLIEVRYGVVASIVNNLARKADVEVVSGLYKRGVISQKQTWASGYSGYTMSNLVYGTIPQANLDLFISAGAEFNDTNAPITKTAPWGDEVQHLPGYFYLNGLGDISYEEMQQIYSATASHRWSHDYNHFLIGQNKVRTNIVAYANTHSPKVVDFSVCAYEGSGLEVMAFTPANRAFPCTLYSSFYGSKLTYFVGILDCDRINSALTGWDRGFIDCYYLKEVKLYRLHVNAGFEGLKNLSRASIRYMIDKANNTGVITITLHADAYARLTDDDKNAATAKNINLVIA